MAQVGIVKELSGVAQAVDADGNIKVLVLGDAINEGEVIVTVGASSSVKISLEDGKELSLGGDEKSLMDDSVVSSTVVSDGDVTAEQQALLDGGELPDEATAVGPDGTDGAGGITEAYTADRSDGRGDVGTYNLGTQRLVAAVPDVDDPGLNLFEPTISINLIDSSVYESGLDNGTGTLPNGINAVGTFTIADLNGMTDIEFITIGGTTFTIAGNIANFDLMVGQSIAVEHGEVTITSYTAGANGQSGTFGYEYVLGEATTDIEGEIETDGFTIVVNDGVFETSAEVAIEIVDDIPLIEDTATVVHDESAGVPMFEISESRMYGPPMENNNVEYADDIFTQLAPMYGDYPIDMIGVALSELSPMTYNAGADGLHNVALTNSDGSLFNGLNSGLKVTATMNDVETSKPIYLYSVTAEFLAKLGLQIDPANEESINLVGDNIVLGLTVDNFDDFVEQLQSQGDDEYNEDGPYDAISNIAFVVGLYEGETDASSDDYLAVLQLQAIHHNDANDHNDEEILDSIYLSVTDGDGDTVTSEAPLSVVFVDDGPTIPSFYMDYPQDIEGFGDFRPPHFYDDVIADEDNLPNGNDNYDIGDDYQANYTLNGTLNFDYGADGPGGIDFAKMDGVDAGFTSNGHSVSYIWDAVDSVLSAIANDGSEDGVVVFTLDINPIYGNYSFTLQDNVDHPEGEFYNDNTEDPNINLALTYTVTDGDGDSIDGELNVRIDDDMPVIGEAESTTVDEEFLATALTQDDGYDGDVVGAEYNTTSTGDLDISWGADDNNTGETNNRSVMFAEQLAPEGLQSHGMDVVYMLNDHGDVLTAYTGVVGEDDYNEVFIVALSDIQSGSYNFELKDTLDHSEGKEKGSLGTEDDINLSFNFIATDSDGDSVGSSFMVTIDDDAPVIPQVENGNGKLVDNLGVHVDDDALANGNPGGISDDVDAKHTTGILSHEYGADGEGTVLLAQGGAPEGFIYTVSQGGTLLMISQDGVDVIKVELSDTTSGNYAVTQMAPIDHLEGNNENNVKFKIHYKVTDVDGDGAKGKMVIHVDDDTPVVVVEQPEPLQFTVTNHDEVSSSEYHSSYGYYVKGDGDEPTSGFIIWDDVHDGDAETFSFNGYDHDEIGYFIIPNGDSLNSNLDDGTPVTFKIVDGEWQAFSGDTPIKGEGSHILFDNASLNKDGQVYLVDNSLEGNQNWEDLQISNGDGDFNDVNTDVSTNGGIAPLMTDESDIDTSDEIPSFPTDTINLSSFFDIRFGADGPNTIDPVIYNLSIANEGVDSGLVDTLSDSAILLKMNAGVVEGYVDGGPTVFTLSTDNNGNVTLTQYRSVVHDDPNDHDEATSASVVSSGLIMLNNVVTDADEDSVTSDSIDISSLVTFRDDGPSITEGNPRVVADEDDIVELGNDDEVKGDDDQSNLTGILSHEYGADGAGSIGFAKMDGMDAGFTSHGDSVSYVWNGVESTLSAVADGGNVVFTVDVDSMSGAYTFELLDSIEHGEGRRGSDNTENPNVNLVLIYTVTDGDGDSVDGNLRVRIDDDMPVVEKNEIVRLDDDALANGNPGGIGDNPDSLHVTGTLDHEYGADGAGNVLLVGADIPNGFSYNVRDGGKTLVIKQDGTKVLKVALDDRKSGDYEVTQLAPIDHREGHNENNFNFDVKYRVTDSDGDSVRGVLRINVDDDTPVTVVDEHTVIEDGDLIDTLVAGNVTNNDSYGADGGEFHGWIGVPTASYGVIYDQGNGAYTYILDNDNSVVDALNVDSEPLTETFRYKIIDGDGDVSIGELKITINGTNDAPETIATFATGIEDSMGIDVVLSGSDVDGEVDFFTINTEPTDGTLWLGTTQLFAGDTVDATADSATVTFIPNGNWSGETTFEYASTDNSGVADITPAVATINVHPVADAPLLSISVGAGEEQTTPQSITIGNVNTTNNGFEIFAYKANGDASTISTTTNINHEGFGVVGDTSNHQGTGGANIELGRGEELVVVFDNTIRSIDVSFAWQHSNNGGEKATYKFYKGNKLVGTGIDIGGNDGIDPAVTLAPSNGKLFDRVVFSAVDSGSDYLINSIDFDRVLSYEYELDISASLTDTDGSESLSQVTLSNLPSGTTLYANGIEQLGVDGEYTVQLTDAVTIQSDTPVNLNSIVTSVTSTEQNHLSAPNDTLDDSATTTVVNDDIEGDTAIVMGSGNDHLIVGDDIQGQATVDMGAGNDILEFTGSYDPTDSNGRIESGTSVNFGEGEDTLIFDSGTAMLNLSNVDNVEIVQINGDVTAETLTVADLLDATTDDGNGNHELLIEGTGEVNLESSWGTGVVGTDTTVYSATIGTDNIELEIDNSILQNVV
ncbi:DUF5801 domain-containing protein [Sulfurospirillum sp.]|nr:DUF5801 domain-containing protein [Sulfurospirillum sp.]